MIGIPGQTYDDLADDIELFARAGPRHDRRRAVLCRIPTRRWADRPPSRSSRRRRAGARHRSDDVQGDRPGAAGVPAGEHPEHHGAGHAERRERPRAGACAAGRTWSCPTSRRRSTARCTSLSRQGLRRRDGRGLSAIVPRARMTLHRGGRSWTAAAVIRAERTTAPAQAPDWRSRACPVSDSMTLSEGAVDFIDDARLESCWTARRRTPAGPPTSSPRAWRRSRLDGRGDRRAAERRRAERGRADLRRRPAVKARRLRQPHRALRAAVRRQRCVNDCRLLRVPPLQSGGGPPHARRRGASAAGRDARAGRAQAADSWSSASTRNTTQQY